MLDIVERQQSSAGISWMRVGKMSIRRDDGTVIGLFGMYEPLDAEEGGRLFVQRQRQQVAR